MKGLVRLIVVVAVVFLLAAVAQAQSDAAAAAEGIEFGANEGALLALVGIAFAILRQARTGVRLLETVLGKDLDRDGKVG